ncbi:MAG: T9SS type A sorting domain-containing protein [Bacteroidetes bacterium]|nr:T9SS type A sorting domain-containing protein [Bacteroidota bacterium]
MQRKIIYLITVSFLSFFSLWAQTPKDACVRISVKVSESPKGITLSWKQYTASDFYVIHRKKKDDIKWPNKSSYSGSGFLTWTDTAIKPGEVYEYRVRRDGVHFGYVTAGIKANAMSWKGKIILLVDDSFSSLKEVKRLEGDLLGDGWNVIRHDIPRTAKVPYVKSVVKSDYFNDSDNVKAVFILGHIAVPYSGSYQVDGHPDHKGGWPSDSYYGDMYGTWSDNTVTDTSSPNKRQWNIPGDGNFDDDVIPHYLDLQVGRVDMNDLPAFGLSETNLIKRYLDKDHNFRHRKVIPTDLRDRAIIDDNFGYFSGESFASSGFRSIAPIVGDSNIDEVDFFSNADRKSYLMGYVCGGGWYQGCSGVGTTDSFAADSIQVPFMMSFGSYFGDWDSYNNFLRAPLAGKGTTLSNCWSGRPHWIMHQLGLGENLGYCARISMSDMTTYYRHPNSVYGGLRNSALMGDPSLHIHTVSPPSNLTATIISDTTKNSFKATLKWSAAKEKVMGYNVYRSSSLDKGFSLINANIITDSIYTDINPPLGKNYYLVRAINLQTTASGSYYNLSQGLLDSATSTYKNGIIENKISLTEVMIFPNPAHSYFNILIKGKPNKAFHLFVTDMMGRQVITQNISASESNSIIQINTTNLSAGVYQITLENQEAISVQKVIITK